MRISADTLTAVVGTAACNAACPYCVSKMTPKADLDPDAVNWRNYRIACRLALQAKVNTVLLTGKGEPTLYPQLLRHYIDESWNAGFGLIELQTNGIAFINKADEYLSHLERWYKAGLTVISLSIAHYDIAKNAQLLAPHQEPYDYWALIRQLQQIGYTVRINCTMCKGYIDSGNAVRELAAQCRGIGKLQLTIRAVARPSQSISDEVAQWVDDHRVDGVETSIAEYIEAQGAVRMFELAHGAIIYDWDGQNICLNNCLTASPDPDEIRQLIFYPDGTLAWDWARKGAIIF